jgi:hypothetical protein
MKELDLTLVTAFVNEHINDFHRNRLSALEKVNLNGLLKRKNPYLFRAKNMLLAADLVSELLEAHLHSSEEELFGQFLERLAILISEHTCNGRKSSATGIDLEFENDGIYYIVSIKSGQNWGNSSQHTKQNADFRTATAVLKQNNKHLNVQPVLGICYGNAKPVHTDHGYLKAVGQSFWHLISDDKKLYLDIIEPLGYEARLKNQTFSEAKSALINTFTSQFISKFCDYEGKIDWNALVRFNSENILPEKKKKSKS